MPLFHACVPTPRASRNMTRLCKHFGHKTQVQVDEHRAHVDFAFGRCRMYALPDRLLIDCEADAGEAEARLRYVLDDHLLRFSGEEALQIDWQEGPLPDAPASSPEGPI
ncbi:DUF2218 domain-containing protein [Stutzerimonas urumqiensis]|uniref:DUF2218 domain-containing protein n=1 Tax=Stutzerimonas urumqiensis TaxID=638269 RepID=UPI000EB21494|nr:DUF2218 domain-containing protein [Stutzerimonas urumqiensis]